MRPEGRGGEEQEEHAPGLPPQHLHRGNLLTPRSRCRSNTSDSGQPRPDVQAQTHSGQAEQERQPPAPLVEPGQRRGRREDQRGRAGCRPTPRPRAARPTVRAAGARWPRPPSPAPRRTRRPRRSPETTRSSTSRIGASTPRGLVGGQQPDGRGGHAHQQQRGGERRAAAERDRRKWRRPRRRSAGRAKPTAKAAMDPRVPATGLPAGKNSLVEDEGGGQAEEGEVVPLPRRCPPPPR